MKYSKNSKRVSFNEDKDDKKYFYKNKEANTLMKEE